MGIIAVSDSYIIIGLIERGLIDKFFSMPYEIHTTDMIIHELKNEEHKRKVEEYKSKGLLKVYAYDSNEMLKLIRFHTLQQKTARLSIPDCSVWLYAMKRRCILLTDDEKLKREAIRTGVDVRCIIYNREIGECAVSASINKS